MKSCLLALFLCISTVSGDAVDRGVKQAGLGELLDLTIPGVTVRECSCEEQNQCVDEIKKDLFKCGDDCFYKFEKLTKSTEDLKVCIDSKETVFNEFVGCVQTNIHACVQNKDGPMIPKHDLLKMFNYAESKVVSQRDSLLHNSAIKPIKEVVETVLDFGGCIKDCFMKKNQQGFCFDRKGCQPLITEKRAISTLKKCIRKLDWKKEAGELCDCSVKAGINSLEKYCPMLRLIAQNRRHGSTKSH